MAIVKKSSFLRSNGDSFSPRSRDSMLSDDDELQTRPSASEVEGGDDVDDGDVDFGLDMDGVDLAKLGEIGGELCGVGDQSCSIPFELFDLPDLSDVLSLKSWNDCLTEEERFRLTEYLPDMDQEPFNRTLKELFSGSNFHLGCPLTEVFDRLKGGRFAPRVALYQQGMDLFQKRKHYHSLRNYQNSMVGSLIQMWAAWENCAGYSIEERLRVLNIFRSQKGLMNVKKQVSGSGTDSLAREEPAEEFWSKKIKDGKACLKSHQVAYNYPKQIKAFYMRLNDGFKTVAAMDVPVPKVGELIGGSQREERYDVIVKRLQEMELPLEPYEWYLDLRHYGTVKHCGFGLGFKRMVLFATGLDNIRDVIPFLRLAQRIVQGDVPQALMDRKD